MPLIPIKNIVYLMTPKWAMDKDRFIKFKVCPNYGNDFPETERQKAFGWLGRGELRFRKENTAGKINLLLIDCLQILAHNEDLKPIEVIRELQKIEELHDVFTDFPPEE